MIRRPLVVAVSFVLALGAATHAAARNETIEVSRSASGEVLATLWGQTNLDCTRPDTTRFTSAPDAFSVVTNLVSFLCFPEPPGGPVPYSIVVNLGALRDGTYALAWTFTGPPNNYNDVVTSFSVPLPPPANFQGLWWVPNGAESGWAIDFAHQGDTIVATWFTYDANAYGNAKGLWLVMTAQKTAPGTYAGKLYHARGPAFNANPFDPAKIGTYVPQWYGVLYFGDSNNGTFTYTVPDFVFDLPMTATKVITRHVFGPLPTCTFGALPDLALATNYTDLWWASPAAAESGWGISLAHQGETIFAAWFTYDLDGSSMWLVATAGKTAPGVYTGTLYRTTGPPYFAIPFDPAKVVATPVGSMTLTFADGNHAAFAYTVNTANGNVSQTKQITRDVFVSPGTACR